MARVVFRDRATFWKVLLDPNLRFGDAYSDGRLEVETGFPVQARVSHKAWGSGIVMREEDDRITVLFDEVGYRTLSLKAVQAKNLLELQA